MILCLAGTGGAGLVYGHGDVHERIMALRREIATSPTNAALYFQRGELHRIHRDVTNAMADFDAAEKLDSSLARLDLSRGRLWLEVDEPTLALPPLNRYLARRADDVEALAARARVNAQLKLFREAATDFSRALAHTPVGSPELYIERAQALTSAGAKEEALRGLDEGIRRMGPLVTLQLPAIDIEVDLKRYDAALARIDAVMARLQRKETWLVRKARVQMSAGRAAEAAETYRAALRAIDSLPGTHRHTRATTELEATIRSALRN